MEGKDFYFQMMTNDDKTVVFLITPKKFYDTEGCLLDVEGAAGEILPRGFTEVQPSFFKYAGNTPEIGKEMLSTIGMIEINFGLTSVKPNRSREHEAGMDDVDIDDEEGPFPAAALPPAQNHGPRVEQEDYEEPELDEDDDDDADEHEDEEENEPEPEDDEEEHHDDDDDFRENANPIQGERPVIIPKIGNLNLGPGTVNTNPIQNNQPLPPAGGPSRPLPPANASNDLDELLLDASADKTVKTEFNDYSGMATDALLRHKKIMLDTESYMEVSKIQKELDARGIK
jgi:hypothetical protein